MTSKEIGKIPRRKNVPKTGMALKMLKDDEDRRNERRFYKVIGEDAWYCGLCGAKHRGTDFEKFAEERLEIIKQIRNMVKNSFGGKDE